MFITYSGIEIDIKNLQLAQINLIDIAYHLTNENRYGRALPFDTHYSVAEHSILLCEYVIAEIDRPDYLDIAKYALFHDASEYLLGDIPTDLKKLLPDYIKLESDVMFKILEKYDISVKYTDLVGALDKRMLLDEVSALTPHRLHYFREKGRQKLGIENVAVNDDDYGVYTPGTVPKIVVYNRFLELCESLGIYDE